MAKNEVFFVKIFLIFDLLRESVSAGGIFTHTKTEQICKLIFSRLVSKTFVDFIDQNVVCNSVIIDFRHTMCIAIRGRRPKKH